MRMGLGALTGEVVAGAKIDLQVGERSISAKALVSRDVVGAVALRLTSRAEALGPAGRGMIDRNWPTRSIFYVASAYVWRTLQQRGLGLALYRTAIEAAWDHHRAVVVSHACIEQGDTSDEALHVWRALGRYYDVVALGDCKAVLGARRG